MMSSVEKEGKAESNAGIRRFGFVVVSLFLVGLLCAGCSKREVPCEVDQVRPLTSYHVVKDGETLSSIAQQYNLSVEELCRMNGLFPSSWLVVGQRVFILPQRDLKASKPGVASSSHMVGEPVVVVAPNEDEMNGIEKSNEDNNRVNSQDDKPLETEAEKEEKLDYKPESGVQMIWPVTGRILRRFNEKLPNGSLSEGINIAAPANINVKACMDGTIMGAGELVHGFGNMVILEHGNGMISIYGHLREISVRCPKEGEKIPIKKGQVIGRVGKTGNVTVPQLHFQLRDAKAAPVDPLVYLPKE